MSALAARSSTHVRDFADLVVTLGLVVLCIAALRGCVDDYIPAEPEPLFVRGALIKAPSGVPMIVPTGLCVPEWSPKVRFGVNDGVPRS